MWALYGRDGNREIFFSTFTIVCHSFYEADIVGKLYETFLAHKDRPSFTICLTTEVQYEGDPIFKIEGKIR